MNKILTPAEQAVIQKRHDIYMAYKSADNNPVLTQLLAALALTHQDRADLLQTVDGLREQLKLADNINQSLRDSQHNGALEATEATLKTIGELDAKYGEWPDFDEILDEIQAILNRENEDG